jgi:hypothetical protein
MKTAVEWYNEQLNLYGDMAFNKEISLGQYHIKKQELLEQAKEMEKQRLEQFYNHGQWAIIEHGHGDTFEDYYIKTFKSE